jgi:hypothetical protein
LNGVCDAWLRDLVIEDTVNSGFVFDLVGEPGCSVTIEASTNMQSWLPLSTTTLGTMPVTFIDAPAKLRQRFYRLVTD